VHWLHFSAANFKTVADSARRLLPYLWLRQCHKTATVRMSSFLYKCVLLKNKGKIPVIDSMLTFHSPKRTLLLLGNPVSVNDGVVRLFTAP
jgi:hypothetical protein